MMRMMWLTLAAAILGWGGTITSGDITIYRPIGGLASFSFAGQGFTANSATFGDAVVSDCPPCTAGISYKPDLWITGQGFGGGPATIDSVSYPQLGWWRVGTDGGSFFRVTSTSTVVTGPGTFHGDFDFSGSLCGSLTQGFGIPCTVLLDQLTGIGTYAVTAVPTYPDSLILTIDQVVFTFLNAEPAIETPEPSTLLLTGLALLSFLISRLHLPR